MKPQAYISETDFGGFVLVLIEDNGNLTPVISSTHPGKLREFAVNTLEFDVVN